MAIPSVTWQFTNGTTSDASTVNTNFTDMINAMTDGAKDFAIGTLSVAGAVTMNGNVTLGNASADDITFTGSLAGSIPVKANATYNFGASTTGLLSVYLGNGSFTTRLLAGTNTASYTFTFPPASPGVTGKSMTFDANGLAEFRFPDKFAAKTANYTATGDETIITCNANSGGASFTVTLPAANTMTGKSLTIIRLDNDLTKTVTVDANGSEIFIPSVQSSALTYILYTINESVTFKCDGTSWYVEQHYAQTDWISSGVVTLTATTSNPTKGTTSTDVLWWRRNAKNVELRLEYVQSATGTAGTGDYLFAIPANMGTIDTTSITPFTTVIGSATVASLPNSVGFGMSRGATNMFSLSVVVYDTTKVRLYYISSSGSGGMINSGAGIGVATANLTYNFFCTLPITGWNP